VLINRRMADLPVRGLILCDASDPIIIIIVILQPRLGQAQVLLPGDIALFLCIPQSLGIHDTIQWWIDGGQVTNDNPEYTTSVDPLIGIGSLQIQNVLLVHNGSRVQCSVNESSRIIYSNQTIILLVEG
jgi:hypothetical protein